MKTITFTDVEFDLLTSFVEMSAETHINLLREDPEFAQISNERGFTVSFAKKLARKCGSRANSLQDN